MLISREYAAMNRQLHEERDDYGRSSKMWCGHIESLVRSEKHESVLDYGCGKGELKARLPFLPIREYDPAIPGKEAKPEPADLVICTDVLEHIEPNLLNSVLRDLARLTKRKLFFAVCTLKSTKTLPDGRNAHLIVRDEEWWLNRLGRYFVVLEKASYMGTLFGEAFPKSAREAVAVDRPQPAPRKRRTITPEWQMFFDHMKAHSAKYSDEFSRINTINMFEDLPDDVDACMQAVVNVLDHVPDPHAMMNKVMKLARKAVLATVALTADRDEDWWRAFFEKYLRIVDWQPHEGRLMCIGSPKVAVEGVVAVGVVAPEDRWQQVLAATQRIKGRIEPSEAHGKRAVVACYGPSLKDNIEALRAMAADPESVVISVSGAHDFLLEHGIKPHYHIECDPREHKAENIEKAIEGVQYLIASACHPAMFDKIEGGDVRLWHVQTPEHTFRLIDEIGESNKSVVSGGGSVGLRSIPLMYALGFRKFTIFGMDCSFSDDGEQQWAGKHAGKRQDLCQVDCNGRIFTSSPILMTYATGFFETVQKVSGCSFSLIGDGLLQSMCALYQGMLPQINEAA